MKVDSISRRALLLVALCAPQAGALAQQPSPARPKEAAAVLQPREFLLPVSGLTADNVAALRDDLMALSTPVYACQACKFEQPTEGTCPKCQAVLKAETRSLFGAVQAVPQENRITLSIDPRASVRLSRIEAVLTKRELKIDDERFALTGTAKLVVRTPSLVQPAVIQEALADLFEDVKAAADSAPNQIVVTVRAGARAPTRAKVNAALNGVQAQLIDLLLVPAPAKP